MRRLNRAEYQYTMADLLGFEMDYSGEFPSDAISGDGFRNNGAALGMSALQIENYLKMARKALDFVLVDLSCCLSMTLSALWETPSGSMQR